jgi:hypothetical protein
VTFPRKQSQGCNKHLPVQSNCVVTQGHLSTVDLGSPQPQGGSSTELTHQVLSAVQWTALVPPGEGEGQELIVHSSPSELHLWSCHGCGPPGCCVTVSTNQPKPFPNRPVAYRCPAPPTHLSGCMATGLGAMTHFSTLSSVYHLWTLSPK